jgi:malate dehydrogenase
MVEAILGDRHRVLPCSAYLQGELGVDGVYVGVPVQLGRTGIERIVPVELTDVEREAFQASAASVRALVDRMAEMAAEAGAGAG